MRPFKELKQDPNRPESTDADDYAFIGAADTHPGHEWVEVRHNQLARFGVETGSSDPHSTANVPFYDTEPDGRWTQRCHLCGKHGTNIYYFCFFLHKPSKVAVVVGQDCARRYELGTKAEREFQGRRDEHFRREEERTRIETAKAFLKRYHEWLQRGGDFFNPFLASLWDQLQERGTLSDKQLDALDRWIYRPDGSLKEQEWTKPEQWREKIEQRIDADRHKAEVTHTDEEPTGQQLDYIAKLAEELGETAPSPQTRAKASDAINELKARVLQQRYRDERTEENNRPASSKQLSYINDLMDERKIPLAERRNARRMLDDGLSSAQASRWITKLKELPFIEE